MDAEGPRDGGRRGPGPPTGPDHKQQQAPSVSPPDAETNYRPARRWAATRTCHGPLTRQDLSVPSGKTLKGAHIPE